MLNPLLLVTWSRTDILLQVDLKHINKFDQYFIGSLLD